MLRTMSPADDERMMIALLPPFGPRPQWMATGGVLKLARGAEVSIEWSTVTFLDSRGATITELEHAFDLRPGTRLEGPWFGWLRDERPRPTGATSMCWSVNDWRSPIMPAFDAEPQAQPLTLTCLPFHVPIRDDRQLFVQFVNDTEERIDLVKAVRSATLWVDDVAYPSITGWHWDGNGEVQPGRWSRWGFRMSDFEGAPLLGEHEVSIEMFGRRTATLAVHLVGEQWTGGVTRS